MTPSCPPSPAVPSAGTAHGAHDFRIDPRDASVLVNVNGELIARDRAVVSVFDAGCVLGDVWASTGFAAPRPREVALGAGEAAVAEACRPAYEALRARRLGL